MGVNAKHVQQSIVSSSEGYIAQVIDSVEFSQGQLSEDQKEKLAKDLSVWIEQSADNFKLSE